MDLHGRHFGMRVHKTANVAGGEADVKSEINVTPLVDVCLVLLIIFMVVTPMLQQGVAVTLPETVQPDKIPEDQRQLNVAIRQSGEIYVNQNPVPEQSVKAVLADILTNNPEKRAVLKADHRLKYKDVRKLMRLINEAGFDGVGLITLKKGGPGGANGL